MAEARSIDVSLEPAAHYRLMTWLSPAYPVGAFSYSSGIEWAVEAGDITDGESLRQWLATMLTDGAGFNDGILFCQAHRATAGGNDAALVEAAELAAALAPTRERYLETTTLGRAFMDVTGAAWPCAALVRLQAVWRGPVAYPIAVGVACAGHSIPLAPAAQGFSDRSDRQLGLGRRSPHSAWPHREPAPVAGARTAGGGDGAACARRQP